MSNGANSIHIKLREELENYIKTQYFGKSPLLLSAVGPHLDDEGILYKKPYIESSPAYKSIKGGIQGLNIPEWLKKFFKDLEQENLGVYDTPFIHQVKALEAVIQGKELFVSTGTGSGKTECFMWPMLAKLAIEARERPETWEKRGIRMIVVYPMNALVSDQISRLRKLIGDPDDKFVNVFRNACGSNRRRPQFGMYTGRTPYAGEEPEKSQDRKLEGRLAAMSGSSDNEYYEHLLKNGKIPAKKNMDEFLANLHESRHVPNSEDAELITRFEMQKFCPDFLITNYSMLEYMLLRPRERKIWEDTKNWLNSSADNKLLFVIDEAHMYRGSAGGEVAFLLRRVFHKLGIGRDKVQFILTTASMPDSSEEDRKKVLTFAKELTAAENTDNFCYLTGERRKISGQQKYDIPIKNFLQCRAEDFESDDDIKLEAINSFFKNIKNCSVPFENLPEACKWLYDNLAYYRPFNELMTICRGTAVSLEEIAKSIFKESSLNDSLYAVGVMLAIATLAKNEKGAVLFPARMHMLFRGITGVYACTNKDCPHSHTDGKMTLGEIFLSDSHMVCPHCGSSVYELYNDRRCGALFIKGYISEDDIKNKEQVYLWHYPGQIIDREMKEIHLFIPPDVHKQKDYSRLIPCYMDVKSGFIDFKDDSWDGKPGIRKLYYSDYNTNGRPDIKTFFTCPHCQHRLSKTQLTPFSTRGNLAFFNLIKAQFQIQPAVNSREKNLKKYPNEGRKVLLFSDSRQRAAKLARDMSEASETEAARQLFAVALNYMEKSSGELTMDNLYDYFCLAVTKNNLQLFSGIDREDLLDHCHSVSDKYKRCQRRNREYRPSLTFNNASNEIKIYLLRLYCAGYNTLYDSAVSWIEPSDRLLSESIEMLDDEGIEVNEGEFLEMFNAWIMWVFDSSTALGQTISNKLRKEVRKTYDGYGLEPDWKFSRPIQKIMGWNSKSEEMEIWRRILHNVFLDKGQEDNSKYYIELSRIRPRFDPNHKWYRCEKCSEITPFLLKGKCPSCADENIHEMAEEEYVSLAYWRNPIESALNGKEIRVIDTEEHTAQLSHKDQRDDIWSKTEEYEMRFQDLIKDNEKPVDILSSTTTMEVGIDIGSLVAVGLRNIPPMRENYQQRAGRAGRRGSSLSTIVTFCEDSPHDTLYFNNPVPMLRGDPRSPWIDIKSEKLLQRHLSIIILQEFLYKYKLSLDTLPAAEFTDNYLACFEAYTAAYEIKDNMLIPQGNSADIEKIKKRLVKELEKVKSKRDEHPELFGVSYDGETENGRSLLDVLYEEGVIPTYSFPKNVVSMYISKDDKVEYKIDRGLDIAISEYAPGRAIVVNKTTYQVGGLFYPGSERKKGMLNSPAKSYIEDPNYLKNIVSCRDCGWFGLESDGAKECPFCGNKNLTYARKMLKPWGFAPTNGRSISVVQLEEEYTYAGQPLYSTVPEHEEMRAIPYCKNIKIASRENQRIIMINKGVSDKGFEVCCDCGAAMPISDENLPALKNVERPYSSKYLRSRCRHVNTVNVNLGYDFVTDMMVLEFAIDRNTLNFDGAYSSWINRAAYSLAEALRLAASKCLDVEFSELVTGYRRRSNSKGDFVDIYLYDSLSSGAGYSANAAEMIDELLTEAEEILKNCSCDSACHKCLKHYRNQNIHGMLDRHAALQLLQWGKTAEKAKPVDVEEQKRLLLPLKDILRRYGYNLSFNDDHIYISRKSRTKEIVVYPAMWNEPYAADTIFVSDSNVKYAKPYAVKKIKESL